MIELLLAVRLLMMCLLIVGPPTLGHDHAAADDGSMSGDCRAVTTDWRCCVDGILMGGLWTLGDARPLQRTMYREEGGGVSTRRWDR